MNGKELRKLAKEIVDTVEDELLIDAKLDPPNAEIVTIFIEGKDAAVNEVVKLLQRKDK